MSDSDKRRYLILKDPNIYKGLIILAFPIMLNNFIKTIHDLVDMYFVSNFIANADEAVSSISLTFPVFWVYISLGIGLSVAGTALISQLVGAGQREDAKQHATNLIAISFIFGIALTILAYILAPIVMEHLMGAEGFVLEKSVKYLRIRAFELLPMILFFGFTSIRQSDGDTVTPVIYGVITMILNIILSPIFIVLLEQGVEGAAYATLVANTVIIPFVTYQLFFGKKGLRINFNKYSIESHIVKPMIKLAIPASTGQAITAVGFIVMNSVILSYGTETVAAFAVGNRISSMVLHPVMAIGGVLAAYIGQNIGNANPERANETFRKGLLLSVGIMAVLSVILIILREPIALIFWEPGSTSLELTVRYLFYLLIGLPLMAVFQTFIGVFNGTGNTKYTFIVSITRLWFIRIPLLYYFKFFTDLGSSGIWYAMLISNFLIAFVSIFFYLKVDYKPKVELDI